MMLVLAAFVGLLLALLAPRHAASEPLARRIERWEAPLRHSGPWVVAVISMLVVWFTWDALSPIPKVHDESSYLLQADIFAQLRWTAPSPPIADFFEQPHVLVAPAVASKYPPGHALLLTLGSLAGFPALIPLLLTGVTAALIFALATRLTNPWTALLAWLIWLTAPLVLRFQPSYFSQLTTTALVLASWWLLLDWRETRRRRWLLLLALAIGWGAITRPLTMLVFAIPLGVVVVRDVVRLGHWRDFALACAVGVAVLSILPLWNARTTGDWRVSPIERYRLDYLPFDKIGFTPDTSAPRRAASPLLKALYSEYLGLRKRQRLVALPLIIADRTVQVAIALFQGARLPLLLFTIAGLFLASTAVRFGVASALLLFLAHLPYAHGATWTVYYLEAVPVVAAVAAIGVWGVARRLAASEPGARAALVLASIAIAAFAVPDVARWRLDHRMRSAFHRQFSEQLRRLPSRHAIVFVRYSPRLAPHGAVVTNYANLAAAPVWVVHDLGPRNEELRRLAPDRASFDFDEDRMVGGRLERDR